MHRLKANRDTSGGKGGVFLLLFGIFWCSLVGAFDYLIVRQTVSQLASTRLQPARARILTSEATQSPGDEGGTVHGVKFEYVYSVNGRTYTGTRYTFDGSKSSDSRWAREAVAEFPAGSERVCYYDPKNPEQAVLARGLHGSDITFWMFMTPFNIVALFFIAYPIWSWRERRAPRMVAPRFVDRLHGREGYALNRYSPMITFFGLFLLTSFVGIFVVVFTGGFHPTKTEVVMVWGGGFVIALWIAVSVHLKTKSGRYYLVIDQNARMITAPPIAKRKTVEMIPIADVQKFEVEKVESGSGEDHKVTWQLKMLADGGREVLLQENYLETQAKRLAETLNAKLTSVTGATDG